MQPTLFQFFIEYYIIESLINQSRVFNIIQAFISIKFLSRPFWTLPFGILIVAICGICGILGTVLKNKNYILVIFNAGNLCFFVSFTLIGVIAIIFGVVRQHLLWE